MISVQLSFAQQSQTFDIVSYQAPAGWEQSSTPETLTFSKEDQEGNFCLITLYRSVESVDDPLANFKMSWETLVQPILGTGEAVMQLGSEDQGWKSEVGSAPFQKGNISGAAILISSTKGSKLVNTLILTNTDRFQGEMERFLEGMSIPEAAPSGQSTLAESSVPEVWMNMQVSSSRDGDYSKSTLKPKFYLIYPNGDYSPHFPPDGLLGFDPAVKDESWGKFTMSGNSGRFQSKYEEIAVEKVSSTEMKKVGYSLNFYKCVPVDGLKLDGQWGRFPDWRKDAISGNSSGINGTGVRQVIEFRKDGTFTDFGVFVTNLLMPGQNPALAPGKGSYSFQNFTLILRYEDGRTVHQAFAGYGDKDPADDSKLIYIGLQPFYSN